MLCEARSKRALSAQQALSLCTDQVCSIVAPDGTQTVSKANESPQRCDERIRRKILDHFQMSNLRGKADKDGALFLASAL